MTYTVQAWGSYAGAPVTTWDEETYDQADKLADTECYRTRGFARISANGEVLKAYRFDDLKGVVDDRTY